MALSRQSTVSWALRLYKKENGERIIFTPGSVKGGDQGFQDLKEGEEVHYRVFNDKIDSIGIARDVWKKHDGGK
jgi:hypothetical protein